MRRPWLKRNGLQLLALTYALGLSAPCVSQEVASSCGALRLAMPTYPRVYERDRDGQETGFGADVARELSLRSGCQLNIVATSPSRTWPALAIGLSDLSAAAPYQQERLADAAFLWLVQSRVLLLMPKRIGAGAANAHAFEGDSSLFLGVVRGGPRSPKTEAWIKALSAKGRVRESADMRALLLAYEAGRVQAALIYPGTLEERGKAWLDQQLQHDWVPQDQTLTGWAMSRKTVSGEHQRRLREAADSLLADGTLPRLMRKHMGDKVASQYNFVPSPGAAKSAPTATP